MKRRILCIVLVALLLLPFLLFLTGCTEADNVNHNLSQAADNFQCLRKITVYNARTDLIIPSYGEFVIGGDVNAC